MKQLLSIDWFQIGCKGQYPDNSNFEIVKMDYATRHFKTVIEIKLNGKRIFTIAREPHAKIIPADHNLVKWDNEFLYSPNSISHGLTYLKSLGLEPKNLARIDLAIDFNKFSNGMHAQTLIRDYFSAKIVHSSHAKFSAIGTDQNKINYQYLRFGTAISRASIYLYNKTKELQEIKFKQYIFQKWIESGLDVTQDVWRLELTIKNSNFTVSDRDTGENSEFNIDQCINDDFLLNVFWAGVNQYFTFKRPTADKNKSRWPNLKLFADIIPALHIDFRSGEKDWTKADKIFIKKMWETNQEMRGTDINFDINANDYLMKFVNQRGLKDWFIKKFSIQ